MPRPPPPAAALMTTGKPTDTTNRVASVKSSGKAASEPGIVFRPYFFAVTFAITLSPIKRMTSGDGPMKTKPLFCTCSAKSAFSDSSP